MKVMWPPNNKVNGSIKKKVIVREREKTASANGENESNAMQTYF